MTKPIAAEYDAAENVLRLVEPIEGLQDHEQVQVTIERTGSENDPHQSWLKLSGIMEGERGDEFARVIEEMFPPWNEDE